MRFLICFCLFSISTFSFSQTSPDYIAHEWGTFTTLSTAGGQLLDGMTRSEEPLPHFVHAVVESKTYYDSGEKWWVTLDSKATHVNARMETPVLYFYSDKPFSANVGVLFYQGSTTEWFPQSSKKENYFSSSQQGVSWHPDPPVRQVYEVDLSDQYLGQISWDVNVLADKSKSSVTHPDSLTTIHWNAPRQTQSNIIETPNHEKEKFIFYRGIAHLPEPPINIQFNTDGNLVIQNPTTHPLAYVAVYQEIDSIQYLYWSGFIDAKFNKVISVSKSSCNGCLEKFHTEFAGHLIEGGLYEDEAQAMLQTWEHSYFHSPGLKVFWIMPPSYIEPILQLNIDPRPTTLKRVFVGRSEIITPGFEDLLLSFPSSDSLTHYFEDDRFLHAYEQFYAEGEKSILSKTLADGYFDQPPKSEPVQQLTLFPNPTHGSFQILIPSHKSELSLKIYNDQGQVVVTRQVDTECTSMFLTLGGNARGMYTAILSGDSTIWKQAIVKL